MITITMTPKILTLGPTQRLETPITWTQIPEIGFREISTQKSKAQEKPRSGIAKEGSISSGKMTARLKYSTHILMPVKLPKNMVNIWQIDWPQPRPRPRLLRQSRPQPDIIHHLPRPMHQPNTIHHRRLLIPHQILHRRNQSFQNYMMI